MRNSIPGYEGLYEADSDGFVVRVPVDRRLKPWITNSGYSAVSLCREGVRRSFLVHRLVLLAFAGPPAVSQEACHGDGNRQHNSLSNLRWDSRSENARERYKHGYSASQVTRQKLSLAHKGLPLSSAHKAKLALAKLGNKNRLGGLKYTPNQGQVRA